MKSHHVGCVNDKLRAEERYKKALEEIANLPFASDPDGFEMKAIATTALKDEKDKV